MSETVRFENVYEDWLLSSRELDSFSILCILGAFVANIISVLYLLWSVVPWVIPRSLRLNPVSSLALSSIPSLHGNFPQSVSPVLSSTSGSPSPASSATTIKTLKAPKAPNQAKTAKSAKSAKSSKSSKT